MSDRYVTAAYIRDFWEYGTYAMTADTAIEPERQAIKTGLLDANGTPLYRVREMGAIGFELTAKAKA